MRKRLLFSVGVASLMVLAGCGSPANPTSSSVNSSTNSAGKQRINLTVAWWGDQSRADDIHKVLQLFEQQHPNIKVTGQYMPFSGYFDKLNTELATGTAPDIFAVGSNINDYADKNVLLNLNPYVSKQLDTSGIEKGLLSFNTFQGKLDGIPTGVNAFGIIANADLFKKAGVPLPSDDWTWSDFQKISVELHQKLGSGYYATYNDSDDNDTFQDYLLQRNKTIADPKTNKIGFDAKDAQGWFDYWTQLQKTGALVPPDLQNSNSPSSSSTSLLETGKVAMQFTPANELQQYASGSKAKFVILPLPKGPNGHGVPLEASQSIVANAKTKHPQAVAELMSFWVNNAQAVKAMGTNIGVPVTTAMRSELKKTASPEDLQLFNYCDQVAKYNVTPAYNMVGFDQWTQALTNISGDIEYGKLTPQQGAQKLVQKAQQIMSANA